MRRTRPLLLLVILLIVIAVGASYYGQRNFQRRQAPAPPAALPSGVSATASGWQWSQTQNDRTLVEVSAKDFRQIKEPSVFELSVVELKVFQKDGKTYDLVKSAKATFDIEHRMLNSDGEVEITMGLTDDGPPKGRLLTIKSSGVTFDSATGRATTDREASFTFDEGHGKSVGAAYDPNTRELQMRSNVVLDWRGRGPKSKPIHIEAGELTYREKDSKIVLSPWSKLKRDRLTLDAGAAFVTLEEGAITLVETENAHGSDRYPDRRLDFTAPKLTMNFGDGNAVERILAGSGGELLAISDTGRTKATGRLVELKFDVNNGESMLKQALAMGDAVVENVPIVKPGAPMPETRVLHSETILAYMRAGGKEMEKVETQAPGTVDFIPNRPGQRHRRLQADRLWMTYGAANRVERLEATEVTTRTDPDPAKIKPKQPPPPPALTSSKGLIARFDPKTGEMQKLEQWNSFRYEEGDRKAQADRGELEQATGLMTLTGGARVWDPTSSSTADRMVLNQKTGDSRAEGHVTSTRQPDRKGESSAMLSQDEPVRATAAVMVATDGNTQIDYQGGAVLWQGANRIAADHIHIDRDEQTLNAAGRVVSQFVDQGKKETAKKTPAPPVYTVVRSASMTYDDETRLAHYKGEALLTRPGMQVSAQEIRAYLKDKEADSSLDRALADGKVQIHQQSPGRKREGRGDHAEYQTGEERVVLYGGEPLFTDSVRGATRGQKLTWWANNDRLLVDGVESHRAESRITRK